LLRYRCEKLILATGARERFLPFVGWEQPKVMGVGALQALCKQGYDLRGRSVVLAGSGPLLMAVAADLSTRGAASVKIIEQAPRSRVWKLLPRLVRHPGKLGQAARFGLKLPPGSIRYGSWIESASLRPGGFELRIGGQASGESMACDLLACAFGLVPEIGIARSLGCASRLDGPEAGQAESIVADERMCTSVAGVYAVGEMCGIGGVECSLVEGALAGRVAAGSDAQLAKLQRARAKARSFAEALARAYALDPRLAGLSGAETILCRCEGVRSKVAIGFDDPATAKLQTRCGMGPCQGRICRPAFEFITGSREPSAPRPPLVPVKLSSLAAAWGHDVSSTSELTSVSGA
jgi:NADPH-dependent 2,4-dienoyl-CoA reductase/sulfur reductase-like enzyme